jgi:hypothetical protein
MKRRMLKWFVILLFAAWCAEAGEYGAAFLDIGVGGKALSMGGAYCSLADDGTAFYWNPAGLGLIGYRTLSGMYGPQFGSLQKPFGHFHYLGLVQPLARGAAVAVSWIRLSIDDIPQYPELQGNSLLDRLTNAQLRPSGEPEGYFSDTEDAFFFSFAKMITSNWDMGWIYQDVRIDIPIGINFKYIRQRLLTYSASGMGLDLGAMMRIHFADLFGSDEFGVFSFGINLQDFTSTQIRWNTRHEDPVRLNTKWGVSYRQPLPFSKHYLLVAFDWDTRYNDRHFGFAYSAFDMIGLRMGLYGKHLTGGAGIRLWRLSLDYAFVTHELNYLHRISCELRL